MPSRGNVPPPLFSSVALSCVAMSMITPMAAAAFRCRGAATASSAAFQPVRLGRTHLPARFGGCVPRSTADPMRAQGTRVRYWSSSSPLEERWDSVRRFGRITTGGDGGDDDDEGSSKKEEFEPTWTYTPYKPPPPSRKSRGVKGGAQRRRFSSSSSGDDDTWKVPNAITVPLDQVELSFVRSSGAGGQNVNKLNTKVEVRIKLSEATWIPGEVRDRIRTNEAGRISKEGYLSVTSQEYRTQAQNRKDALSKLEEIVLRAYPRPKVRKMRKGVSKKAKERNKENKRRRSQVKANRKRVEF